MQLGDEGTDDLNDPAFLAYPGGLGQLPVRPDPEDFGRPQRGAAGGGNAADREALAGGGPTPSRVAVGKEPLANFFGRLSDEERQIADLRARGLGWEEVAGRLGGTATGRRMQLTRAAERVARELALDEGGDG
jgi:hypothetical protein